MAPHILRGDEPFVECADVCHICEVVFHLDPSRPPVRVAARSVMMYSHALYLANVIICVQAKVIFAVPVNDKNIIPILQKFSLVDLYKAVFI